MANKLLPVLTGIAAIITATTPAHADTDTDAAFLKNLDKAGITYQSPDRAIAAGKKICDLASMGATQLEILNDIRELNPGFTLDSAAKFTDAAASAYCPDHLSTPANKHAGPNTKSE